MPAILRPDYFRRARMSQGLIQAVTFGLGFPGGFDVLRRVHWDAYNANALDRAEITLTGSSFGVGAKCGHRNDGGDKFQSEIALDYAYGTGEWQSTFFCLRLVSFGSDGHFADHSGQTDYIRLSSNDNKIGWEDAGLKSTSTFAWGADHTIGINFANGSTMAQDTFINGRLDRTATAGGGPARAHKSIDRLAGINNSFAGVEGIWHVFYEWNRYVTPDEYAVLHRDPWLLVRNRQAYMPLNAVVGGGGGGGGTGKARGIGGGIARGIARGIR